MKLCRKLRAFEARLKQAGKNFRKLNLKEEN